MRIKVNGTFKIYNLKKHKKRNGYYYFFSLMLVNYDNKGQREIAFINAVASGDSYKQIRDTHINNKDKVVVDGYLIPNPYMGISATKLVVQNIKLFVEDKYIEPGGDPFICNTQEEVDYQSIQLDQMEPTSIELEEFNISSYTEDYLTGKRRYEMCIAMEELEKEKK